MPGVVAWFLDPANWMGSTGIPARLAEHGELATVDGEHLFRSRPEFKTSALYALAEDCQLPARLFVTRRPTLEALFLHLTGRTLRE